jgi:hypothetical protein
MFNHEFLDDFATTPAPGQPGTLAEQLALAQAGLARRPRLLGRMAKLCILATLADDPAWRAALRAALRKVPQ